MFPEYLSGDGHVVSYLIVAGPAWSVQYIRPAWSVQYIRPAWSVQYGRNALHILTVTPQTAARQAPRPWESPGKTLEWGAMSFSNARK